MIPCPRCGNEKPSYAMGWDKLNGVFYIRDSKCNKGYVFVNADINVVRAEMLRLNGEKSGRESS